MNYKDFIKIAKDIIRKIEDERPGEISLTEEVIYLYVLKEKGSFR